MVVLNDVANSVIEKQRGNHPLYVFPFGKPDGEGNEMSVHHMNDSAWKKAGIRVAKNWQEKFSRPVGRLRAAGVIEEDRKTTKPLESG